MEGENVNYTPTELAAVAEETAQKVGCEMVHWEVNQRHPPELRIEAIQRLSSGKAITVELVALL